MKPIQQTIFVSPHGNCLQACVASIFELELDQVPNFVDDKNWLYALQEFCAIFGVFPYIVDLRNRDPGIQFGYEGKWFSIVTGKSPRGPYLHAVVSYNGKIIHDPYPGGDGKLGDLVDEIVFVVKDVSRYIAMMSLNPPRSD